MPLLAGCSSSNSPADASAQQRSCLVALEPSFKLERGAIFGQLQAAIEKGQRNPQDPTVKSDLATVSQELNSVDQAIQSTTCPPGGFDYLRTVQGVSSGMKRAAMLYTQGLTDKNSALIQQSVQQLGEITRLLRHAADITSPGK